MATAEETPGRDRSLPRGVTEQATAWVRAEKRGSERKNRNLISLIAPKSFQATYKSPIFLWIPAGYLICCLRRQTQTRTDDFNQTTRTTAEDTDEEQRARMLRTHQRSSSPGTRSRRPKNDTECSTHPPPKPKAPPSARLHTLDRARAPTSQLGVHLTRENHNTP